jgi:hypothetical protein
MVNAKKIYTRTVTVERFLIRGGPAEPAVLLCSGCGRLTVMLDLEQASAAADISMRDLFHLSEDGVIHSTESDTGRLLFCRESITEFSRKRAKENFWNGGSDEEIDDDCA